MTTDPTPLQERIRRARSVPADWAKLREGESTREQIERHQERMDEQTTALIATEVRREKADALRAAAEDPALRLSGHSGISITRLRTRATDIEQED